MILLFFLRKCNLNWNFEKFLKRILKRILNLKFMIKQLIAEERKIYGKCNRIYVRWNFRFVCWSICGKCDFSRKEGWGIMFRVFNLSYKSTSFPHSATTRLRIDTSYWVFGIGISRNYDYYTNSKVFQIDVLCFSIQFRKFVEDIRKEEAKEWT